MQGAAGPVGAQNPIGTPLPDPYAPGGPRPRGVSFWARCRALEDPPTMAVMRGGRWLVVGCLWALCGCKATNFTLGDGDPAARPKPSVAADYEPLTAVKAERSTASAALVYRGDAAALDGVEGRPLGALTLTAPAAMAPAAVDGEAKARAAALGGSHVLRIAADELVSSTVDEDATRRQRFFWALSGMGDEERCKNGDMRACRHQLEPAPVVRRTKKHQVVRYLVIAVPPGRWGELPADLRPIPRSSNLI